MAREINKVWIFGPSAVGKKTAMFQAANPGGAPSLLRAKLNVSPAEALIPWVIPVEQAEDFPEARLSSLRHIMTPKTADSPITYLIHGQGVDFIFGLLDALRREFGSLGSAVFVHTGREAYEARCRKRGVVGAEWGQQRGLYVRRQEETAHLFNEIITLQV